MWLFICCKCSGQIKAENVAECPKCGGNSWLCHWLEDKAVSNNVNLTKGLGERAPTPPPVNTKQLALL